MIRAILVTELLAFATLGMVLWSCVSFVMDHRVQQAELQTAAEYITRIPPRELAEISL